VTGSPSTINLTWTNPVDGWFGGTAIRWSHGQFRRARRILPPATFRCAGNGASHPSHERRDVSLSCARDDNASPPRGIRPPRVYRRCRRLRSW
jgi:hypothetical protein